MKRALFLLLFLSLLAPTAGAQVTSYTLAGGEVDEETIANGQYLPIVQRQDTLLLWIESVTKEDPPSREKARAADIVVWCYPDRYPDPRHPLPGAEIVVVRQSAGRLIFAEQGILPSRLRKTPMSH